jgi:hypothetical protein
VAEVLEALARANFNRDIGAIDTRAAVARGWKIIEDQFPILDVLFIHARLAPLRLKLICRDWDDLPPSIELLDESGAYLKTKPPGTEGQFHPGEHPTTRRPFVCMRGALEYHTHPSHVSDHWANYRGQQGMDLGGIVFQLWRVWMRSTA